MEPVRLTQILAITLALVSLALPACNRDEGEAEEEHYKIVVTTPKVKDVVLTQQYVCQIHSQRHIKVCALENGYIEKIEVNEGQRVTEKAPLFKILPTLYTARRDAEVAEANLAQLELDFTKNLSKDKVVSENEVALYKAKLAKAKAKAAVAQAELDFTVVKAPFSGIVDKLEQREGSLVKEGEVLTTLSDNSVMWVYFNVPEARYLEYKSQQGSSTRNSQYLKLAGSKIELLLANGSKFPYDAGDTVTVEAKFNNETGNIPFRADFRNPEGLLRHGQTGNVLITHTQKNAIVIPQRATFEILDKQYVFVVDKDNVVHQREIFVDHEQPDIFIIKSGLGEKDRLVLEGVRQVHDGQRLEEVDYVTPDKALENLKYHAE